MQLTQHLAGETPLDELVSMARTLASRLRGESIPFVELRRSRSSDRNDGSELLEAEWHGPGVKLSARIVNGDGGNPRDGWGYDIDLTLRIEPGGALAEALTMELHDGSSTRSVWSPTLRFECTTLESFDRACAIVRELLVGRRDETDAPPWSTFNAEALLRDGNERDARTLVERCWSRESTRTHVGVEQSYWQQFLALRARLVPQSTAMRARRLREDPGALDEWAGIARGEFTADGFARTTASWCAALLAPYQPTLLGAISDERHELRAPLLRLRRSVAAMLATPAWFPTTADDDAARRASSWAAIAEHDDGSDGGWFRVTDRNPNPADAGSIGGAATRALLVGSPLERSGSAAHRIDGSLVDTRSNVHGALRIAFEPRPGSFRAEWSAAWGEPTERGAIPSLWVDLCWTLNTRDTLYRWHWLWTAGTVQGVIFVDARHARPGAPQLQLPADHPVQGDTGWLRGDTFARIIGDARWRDRVIEKLAALSIAPLTFESIDPSRVRW
jgi:hypothetical protein